MFYCCFPQCRRENMRNERFLWKNGFYCGRNAGFLLTLRIVILQKNKHYKVTIHENA